MQQRRLTADQIFTGTELVQDKVLITTGDGRVEALVPAQDVLDDVEYFPGILSPGFINCHCHLELSHMKGKIPEKTGLVDFVFKVVSERQASPEEIAEAIEVAEQEMKEGGIVAVGDICNNASTLVQKSKANLQYQNFIEASGWLPSVADARFERSYALWQLFHEQNPLHTSLVPHAPYSVSENLWEKLQPQFRDKVVSIHNQETLHEDDFFRHGTGDFNRMYALMNLDNSHHLPTQKSSLQSYLHHMENAASLLLVHNTFTQADDVAFAKRIEKDHPQLEISFCLCINANLYIEDALPPVEMLRQNGCRMVMGTDSLASNWSLDILDEMRTIKKHVPQLPLAELLKWATRNGAEALHFDDLGSFDAGKKPGVVNLSTDLQSVKRIL